MLGEACALGAAAVWAVSVILFKRSEAASPQAMNLFKNLVAVVLLVVTMPALGIGFDRDRPAADWALLAASGLLGIAVGDTLVFEALRRLGPALLAVVDLIYAPVLVLFSMLFLGERVGAGFVVGAVLVVGGLLVVTAPAAARTAGPSPEALRTGVIIGIVGIVTMGLGVIVVKPILERSNLVEVTLVRLLAGVAGQLLWIAAVPSQRRVLAILRPSPVWRTLIPASVLGSYVAMLLWLGGFKWADASVASVLNQMSAIFVIVLARLTLGDVLGTRRTVGASLAFAGALVVLLT